MKKFKLVVFCLTTLFYLDGIYAQEASLPDALKEPASGSIGFIKNNGQILDVENNSRPDIYFQSVHSSPTSFYLKDKIAFVYMSKTGQSELDDTIRKVEMTWRYSDVGYDVVPYGIEETDEVFNYYLAHCNTDDCANIKKQKGLLYENIYPGIDMKVYSNETFLKYYFVVKEDANPRNISLSFEGHDHLEIFENNIILTCGPQIMIVPSPIAYQIDTNNIVTILPWQPKYEQALGGRLKLTPMGAYDQTKKLVYQIGGKIIGKSAPEQRNLEWSTYFGGSSGSDEYWDIETNLSGQVYITGYANSVDFPVTTGASQSNNAGGADIVVCKFDNNLKLLWSTYHGGSNDDGFGKHGITVDNAGNAYIAATTFSNNIPLKTSNINGAYFDAVNTCQSSNQCRDLIVAKYDNQGLLQWSTFLGGYDSYSSDADIFIDNENNLFVTGREGGSGMPFTTLSGAYNSSTSGGFIARFNSNLVLDWCTGFGSQVYPSTIIKANDNKLYIAGSADDGALPIQTFPNAYNQAFGGGSWDAFISRFNSILNLEWSTYVGGNGKDWLNRLNADPDPNNLTISLIGNTNSNNFPVVSNSGFVQSTFAGPTGQSGDGDLCIAQFSGTGSLTYSSFYGGSENESGYGIATYFGQKFYAGKTNSTDFPLITLASHPNTLYYNNQFYNSAGGSMAYVLGLDKFSDRKWTTFYGGETQLGAFNGATIHSLKFSKPYLYFTGYTQATSLFPSYGMPGGYSSNNISGGLIGRFHMSNTVLGIRDVFNTSEGFGLYPNPTNGLVKINNNQDISGLSVMNIIGQEVFSVKNPPSEIDFSFLPNSIYLVEIINKNKETYYVKLVRN